MIRRRATILTGVGVVAAICIATVAVFLVRSNETGNPGGTDAGFSISPVGTDPAQIAVAVMSGVFTWQPAVQSSPWEALHNQREHLTGTMYLAAAEPPSQLPQPHPDWAAWARSRDTITSVVHIDGAPTTAASVATVPVVIAQTVQHLSRESTPYTNDTATVQLENHSGTWKVSTYHLQTSTP